MDPDMECILSLSVVKAPKPKWKKYYDLVVKWKQQYHKAESFLVKLIKIHFYSNIKVSIYIWSVYFRIAHH